MEPTVYDLLLEFMEKIDDIYGVYLDSTHGFYLNKLQEEESQKKSSEMLKVSIKYLDSCMRLYGIGNPNEPSSIILHECTQR